LNKETIKKYLKTRTSPIGIILSCNLLYRKSPFVNVFYTLKTTLQLIKCIKEKYGDIQYIFTHTGKIIFFYKDIVIKIPLSKYGLTDLENELENHTQLKKFPLFSYSLKRKGLFFLMSRLNKPNKKIQEKKVFDFLKSIVPTQENILDFDNVLKHLTSNISSKFSDLKSKIKTTEIKYSPNHNDFTIDNIMEFKNRLVLIDISKFEFSSFSEFDKIHYNVNNSCLNYKTNFFSLFLTNKLPMNEKHLIYFIYRVYFETKLNTSSNYISLVEKTISYFKDHYDK